MLQPTQSLLQLQITATSFAEPDAYWPQPAPLEPIAVSTNLTITSSLNQGLDDRPALFICIPGALP